MLSRWKRRSIICLKMVLSTTTAPPADMGMRFGHGKVSRRKRGLQTHTMPLLAASPWTCQILRGVRTVASPFMVSQPISAQNTDGFDRFAHLRCRAPPGMSAAGHSPDCNRMVCFKAKHAVGLSRREEKLARVEQHHPGYALS